MRSQSTLQDAEYMSRELVRFRLPGTKKEIETDARIAWIDRRLGMGLDFTRIAEGDQRALDEFIRSHFFSNRKA
jgi:hypothetical protein